MYAEIRCPSCFTLIETELIDLNEKSAYCKSCDNRFSIDISLENIRHKYESYAPKSWDILKTSNTLTITIPLESVIEEIPGAGFAVKISTMFNRFMAAIVILFLMAFIVGYSKQEMGRGNTISLISGILIAVSMLGVVVYFFFIKGKDQSKETKIDVTSDWLIVKNPTSTDKESTRFAERRKTHKIPSRDIQQLYVEEVNIDGPMVFDVKIEMKSGKIQSPFLPFLSLQQARYIEQEVEKALRITDKKNPKEYLP